MGCLNPSHPTGAPSGVLGLGWVRRGGGWKGGMFGVLGASRDHSGLGSSPQFEISTLIWDFQPGLGFPSRFGIFTMIWDHPQFGISTLIWDLHSGLGPSPVWDFHPDLGFFTPVWDLPGLGSAPRFGISTLIWDHPQFGTSLIWDLHPDLGSSLFGISPQFGTIPI